MPLMNLPTGHPKEIELEMMSKILDKTSTIYDHVLQDLNGGLKVERHRTGANGMSAKQVTRAAIVMKLFGFTYEDLAFISLTPNRSGAFAKSVFSIRASRNLPSMKI